MFVENRSSHRVVCARAVVGDRSYSGALCLEMRFRAERGRWVPEASRGRQRSAQDPPDVTRYVHWNGASVSVEGTVRGPMRGPFRAHAAVAVGAHRVAVAVSGDRVWRQRILGNWELSEPAAFDAVPLSFARAFGGTWRLSAGRDEKGRPVPARVIGAPNHLGRGFCMDESLAEGLPAPNLEAPEDPLVHPMQPVHPRALCACPEMPGVRTASRNELAHDLHHYADPALVLPAIAPGTTLRLEGMDTPEFGVPVWAVAVSAPRSIRWGSDQVRVVHVDTARRRALVVLSRSFAYEGAVGRVVGVRDALEKLSCPG